MVFGQNLKILTYFEMSPLHGYREMSALTIASLNEAVDLGYRDDVGQHVTQPLRVHKVEVAQGRSSVVEHDAWWRGEGGRGGFNYRAAGLRTRMSTIGT